MAGSFVKEGDRTLEQFMTLLESCKAQAVGDPSGYVDNPHLYESLNGVYESLCHGMARSSSSGNNFQTPRGPGEHQLGGE